MNHKHEKISQLSKCIFVLEAKHGHLQWKVTELEKRSGVSRALIYRYLGNTKSEIFKNGFGVFIQEFYGFDPAMEDQDFVKRVAEARAQMQEFSDAIIFYQKWRASEAKMSENLVEIELKFQKKLKNLFPDVTDENIPIVHAFLHGLVTAPFLDPVQTTNGLKLLHKLGLFGNTKVNFE